MLGGLLTRLFHKKRKGVQAEQVVAGGEKRGAKRGTGNRSSQVSGFHKAGLSQLNGGGMTLQVHRGLCNKHSNRGLPSGQIIEHFSERTLTRWPWNGVMGSKKCSFFVLFNKVCEDIVYDVKGHLPRIAQAKPRASV